MTEPDVDKVTWPEATSEHDKLVQVAVLVEHMVWGCVMNPGSVGEGGQKPTAA